MTHIPTPGTAGAAAEEPVSPDTALHLSSMLPILAGELRAGDRLIATASGVFKRVPPERLA